MTYTINLSNYTPTYRALIKPRFKINALQRLRAFPKNTTEKLLDQYLKENYQITLNHACYLIIFNCKIEELNDILTIDIKDKNLDKIARIITFGTGRISGSRILPFVLNKL
jgi:uncharacterized protein with ATP-grasp and redox domains